MAGTVDVYGREVVPALTAARAAALDTRARDHSGVPESVLMENAGRSAALLLQKIHPAGPVLGFVGPGNNGGDALVVLRTLAAWGREVSAFYVGSATPRPELLHGHVLADVGEAGLEMALAEAAVVVDGILGTGARGAPRPPAAAAIEAINAAGRPVVALDLPSGVEPDTGAVPTAAVSATLTVCFGAPKRGLLFQPGRASCGRLVSVEIGFPPFEDEELDTRIITPGWAAARLPRREPDAHKGTVGRIAILAGGPGMGGAAIMAARGAVRAGAGLVYAVSEEGNRGSLHEVVPDAIVVDRDDADAVAEAVGRSVALVAGPGLGRDEAARAALDRALDGLEDGRPALLDADAVTVLALDDALAPLAARRPLVITPHPGEFSTVTGLDVADVDRDRVGHAREAARRLDCVVLLKGMPSVVAEPDGRVWINSTGSSDLATAGMGDHLSGAIGALLGNGAEPAEAAALGLFFSSRAADLAGLGRSLLPDDVADAMSRAFAAPGAAASPSGLPFVTFDQPPRW